MEEGLQQAISTLHEDFDPKTTIPHPDPVIQEWGQRVVRRMREHGHRVAPWQHEEIWFWVARTNAGREWLEREIEYWHRRMNEHDAAIVKTKRRKPILKPGDPVEYVDADEEHLPFSEQLRRREKREFGRSSIR